jgi:hypothetical protein
MSDILSLLIPPGSSKRVSVRRPLIVSAILAALGAGASLMLPLMALALVGWLSTGADGSSRGALRVGADAWLLAHGSGLEVGGSLVTFIPLGLTAFSLMVCHRTARWAAGTSEVEEPITLAIGVFAFAVSLGLTAIVTAVLASTPSAQPGLLRAFLGALVVGLVGGGSGLVSGSEYRLPVPGPVRAALSAATAIVLTLLAVGSVLVVASFLAHFSTAARLVSSLHLHTAGGLLVLAASLAVAPNLSLLGVAYLLGPGFAVGTGTIVSPTDVLLGPVPAVPFVAAIPDGTPAWWSSLLVLVPALVAALVVVAQRPGAPANRLGPLAGALVRGLATGVFAALGVTAVVLLAGGAIGPGRMQDVGAAGASVLVAATISLVTGSLVGSLVSAWTRHRALNASSQP